MKEEEIKKIEEIEGLFQDILAAENDIQVGWLLRQLMESLKSPTGNEG